MFHRGACPIERCGRDRIVASQEDGTPTGFAKANTVVASAFAVGAEACTVSFNVTFSGPIPTDARPGFIWF